MSLSIAPQLSAQDASEEAIEKISVTGSRIKSAELSSASPLQILNAVDIDASGIANIQELLLDNPTFGTPAISRTNSNFNTASAGIATVDLRNLNTSRTLVLVDGRRSVAGQPGTSAVDLNTIPAQFIERVEILTGGASSVYGSDAVAGVVNLVLKDSFEGFNFEAQYGESAESDNQQTQLSMTTGGETASGKGNIMFHLGYTDQGAVYSRDRDRSDTDIFSEFIFSGDPSDAFVARSPFFSSFPPQGRFDAGGTRYTFNQNNELQAGFSTNGNGQIGPDGFNRSAFRTIAIPTERYLIASKGDYELHENHSFFFESQYASTSTISELEPFPFASDNIYADGVVPLQFRAQDADGNDVILTNPFVPDDILNNATVNSSGLKELDFFAKRLLDVGNRGATAERDTFRFVTGIEGEVFDEYFYEVYYVYGKTKEAQVSSGLVNVQNFRFALEAVVDELDFDGDGQTSDFVCVDATARSFGCVPINIYGFNSISEDALKYVTAPALLSTAVTQELIGGNITGDLFDLPAGPIGFAAGFEYREETSRSEFDPLQQAGLNGGNAIPATFGEFDVTEGYIEANIPIIENVNIRSAVRASDYSTVGSTTSWNIGLEWEISDTLRFRAIEALSTRAPNINELFSPPSQTFPSGLNDPCAANVTAQCLADPGVAANIAENGSFVLTQADIQGISGFNRGNPNVIEEKGRSTTLGLVWSPTDELDGLGVTVDYFDIDIEDAIVGTGRQFILDQCYSGADVSFCDFITRRPAAIGSNNAGSIEFIDSGVSNSGGLGTEGVDLTVNYRSEIGNGSLTTRLAYTYVIDGFTVPLPGAAENPFVGEIGASEHRGNLNIAYTLQDFSITTGITYIGSADLDDQFLAGFNLDPGSVGVGSETIVDLQANYFLTDQISVYAGVDNLFDNEPPPIISGLPSNSTGTETDAGTYDPIGQRFYVGVRVNL
ncbi:TonB-dependent receptor domain-containing protein [Alteromonas oceanisediminis]|uniref:TonB-dependent receptor domain-containing protein n=1 Tax=Alteromonas oceanisediminis TaxID=2836180 RepID=UPI0028F4321A|nr:TonB-dependent receptor [Alteromonas oceanisediminis]